ncbi:protein of unknown function DUF481 [Thioalkalivibrio sp. K90mix]|uniref:DUF481 domain-containing protein n=1 Tax=Thioalkalivibrio sp. (strain K90mix) TaxID=396595 RepID=UPI0001C4E247|nr:DUF481 domain-containing protein [Thioalkalivibrio sp. K90mix]ADC72799.1 protein of unknown function DUF481 [Thioalkalivibrio sp. K90mix]
MLRSSRPLRSSLALFMLVSIPALPAVAWDAEGWETSIELGASKTTGNTESTTANARFRSQHTSEEWRNRLRLDGHYHEEDDNTTGERYVGGYQLDRKLGEHDYLFGAARYERDRFSSYVYQGSLTTGYGRRLVDFERVKLDAEIGGGMRQYRERAEGDRDREPVARLAGNFRWDFSENARLTDELLILHGSDNTEIENILSLTADMTSRLALRTSFTVKHNTDVEPGTENTDTITDVSLVYRFH